MTAGEEITAPPSGLWHQQCFRERTGEMYGGGTLCDRCGEDYASGHARAMRVSGGLYRNLCGDCFRLIESAQRERERMVVTSVDPMSDPDDTYYGDEGEEIRSDPGLQRSEYYCRTCGQYVGPPGGYDYICWCG